MGLRPFGFRAYAMAVMAALSLSQVLAVAAARLILVPFRGAWDVLVLSAVLVFLVAWAFRARPGQRPKRYRIAVFDVYGKETAIVGLRTDFGRYDVACCHAREYKGRYPANGFAITGTYGSEKRRTVFSYL